MDNREVWLAAVTTEVDWDYYDNNSNYAHWWHEFNDEGLDPELYIVSVIFTSH